MESVLLRRLIKQLVTNGKSRAEARSIAVTSLQKSGNLVPGSTRPTGQGKIRGSMTPAERAIDRAQKESPGDYKYNPFNNSAIKGEINPEVKRRS